MVTFSAEQRSIMQEKLTQAIKDFSYRFKRYEINYSIAIGYSPEELDLTPLSHFIRESDRFVVLDQHTYAIILDCTDDESGIKAANNLLTHYQGEHFSKPLYTSIVTADNFDTVPLMIQELFYLLDYALEHNMNSILMESSQVMQKH